jgi:hypothetical protein
MWVTSVHKAHSFFGFCFGCLIVIHLHGLYPIWGLESIIH